MAERGSGRIERSRERKRSAAERKRENVKRIAWGNGERVTAGIVRRSKEERTDGQTDGRTDGRTDEWTAGGGEEREREKETTGWGSSQTPRGELSNYTSGSASRPPSSSPLVAPMIKTHHGFSATTRCARARAFPDGESSLFLAETRAGDALSHACGNVTLGRQIVGRKRNTEKEIRYERKGKRRRQRGGRIEDVRRG